MIQYVFGFFTGGFAVFMVMAIFIGRPAVIRERERELKYSPDVKRSIDDDWEYVQK